MRQTFYLDIHSYQQNGGVPDHGLHASTKPGMKMDGTVRYAFTVDVPAIDPKPDADLRVLDAYEVTVPVTKEAPSS